MAANSFCFLHASDFHLDQLPGGLTELPPELVDPLMDATYTAVAGVFDVALRERVAFVVLAGDIIHFPTASARALDFLGVQLGRLDEAKIPVYWLGGRLESGHPLPEQFLLPKHVHRLATTRVQTLEVKQDRKTIAYIVGQSCGDHADASLSEMRVPRDGRFFVGLRYVDGQETLDRDVLDELGIDYWAFGGRHQRETLDTLIPAEFSGTPQGRLPSEQGPHGCLLVRVTGDDIDDTHLVETDAVRYRTERIVVGAGDDREQLAAKMKSRLQTIRHDVDVKKPILVTWEIEDDGLLGAELRRFDQGVGFLEQFRRDTKDLQGAGNMWSIGLRSQRATVPSRLFDEDSILGDFLRVVRELEQAADPTLDVHALLPDTPSAKKLAEKLHLDSPFARQQLLREVTTMGIDLLSGEAK